MALFEYTIPTLQPSSMLANTSLLLGTRPRRFFVGTATRKRVSALPPDTRDSLVMLSSAGEH